MVYGSAEFMYVPLETTIKVYREKLGKKSFGTLREYAADFIRFLDNGNPIFPESIQDRFAEETFYSYFSYVKDLVTKRVQAVISERSRITRKAIGRIVTEVIREQYHMWRVAPNIPSIPKSFNDEVLNKYSEAINTAIKEVLENLPLSGLGLTRLRKTAASLFSKYPEEIERD